MKNLTLRKKSMLIIFSYFIGLMGFASFCPFSFYAERLGITRGHHIDYGGLLTRSVYCLSFWGRLRILLAVKVLIISLIGSSISYVMLAFAETLTMVIISRVLSGLMAEIFQSHLPMLQISQMRKSICRIGKVSAHWVLDS